MHAKNTRDHSGGFANVDNPDDNPDYDTDPCRYIRLPELCFLTVEECDISRRLLGTNEELPIDPQGFVPWDWCLSTPAFSQYVALWGSKRPPWDGTPRVSRRPCHPVSAFGEGL